MTFPSSSSYPDRRGPSESSTHHPYLAPHQYHLTNQSTPDLSRVASPTETVVDLPATATALGDIPTDNYLNAAAYSAPAPNQNGPQRKVNRIARRVHGWTWQAFPVGMGTGAVYVTMSGLKDRSPALKAIETVFFFINISLFCLNVTTLAIQALLYPRQAKRLVTDPSKNIFVPLVVLSFATIVIGTINYAIIPGLIHPRLAYILFWIYVGLSVVVSFPLLMIWYNKPHNLSQMSPAWMFLVFPMMLVGVVAFNVLRVMDPADERSVGVLFVGYFFQGIGSMVTLLYLAVYFMRIMTTGFMEGHQANGAFVAAGPPGFTALALINLGARAREILPLHDIMSDIAGEVWYASSVLGALLLFGFAIFLVLFGALPYWFKLHKHLNEILGCWALTFPNVGWIGSLGALSDALKIPGLRTVQIVCVIIIAMLWLVLATLTFVAFWRGLILRSQSDAVIADEERKVSFGISEKPDQLNHRSSFIHVV
ncbi:hypothetical protein PENSPDRAFT_690169 [Peniophora sp. CONT]|nr:hypothetical protein PENSPDRAFT_690169 [Peniophora sp. CONT]